MKVEVKAKHVLKMKGVHGIKWNVMDLVECYSEFIIAVRMLTIFDNHPNSTKALLVQLLPINNITIDSAMSRWSFGVQIILVVRALGAKHAPLYSHIQLSFSQLITISH